MRIRDFPETSDLIERHGLVAFCETGTFRGDSCVDARYFELDPIYSIDISLAQVEAARDRCPYATIYHGNSRDDLKKMIQSLQIVESGPVLFFLDAHLPDYHGIDFEDDLDTRYPLKQEIDAIVEHKKNFQQDVIVCDDIRMFTLGNEHAFKAEDQPVDQMCHHVNVERLVASLSHTHKATIYAGGHGTLVFEPRQHSEL